MSTQVSINGYLLHVNTYDISKSAKIAVYTIPNANRSVLLPEGSFNTTFTIETQSITDVDLEVILSYFNSNNALTLTDIEGNNHSVYCQQYDTDFESGKNGYYVINATFQALAE